MPQRRDPFMWIARNEVLTGLNLDLITEPIRNRDQVLYCDVISLCNHTSSGGDVTVGLVFGGRFFELETIYGLLVGMWADAVCSFTFLSNWQIFARFHYEEDDNGDPCGAGDDCELHVVGYTLEEFTTP